MNVELKAKCTTCKKVYAMTEQQKSAARDFGCAFSPCCHAVATVEHVSVRLAQERRRAASRRGNVP